MAIRISNNINCSGLTKWSGSSGDDGGGGPGFGGPGEGIDTTPHPDPTSSIYRIIQPSRRFGAVTHIRVSDVDYLLAHDINTDELVFINYLTGDIDNSMTLSIIADVGDPGQTSANFVLTSGSHNIDEFYQLLTYNSNVSDPGKSIIYKRRVSDGATIETHIYDGSANDYVRAYGIDFTNKEPGGKLAIISTDAVLSDFASISTLDSSYNPEYNNSLTRPETPLLPQEFVISENRLAYDHDRPYAYSSDTRRLMKLAPTNWNVGDGVGVGTGYWEVENEMQLFLGSLSDLTFTDIYTESDTPYEHHHLVTSFDGLPGLYEYYNTADDIKPTVAATWDYTVCVNDNGMYSSHAYSESVYDYETYEYGYNNLLYVTGHTPGPYSYVYHDPISAGAYQSLYGLSITGEDPADKIAIIDIDRGEYAYYPDVEDFSGAIRIQNKDGSTEGRLAPFAPGLMRGGQIENYGSTYGSLARFASIDYDPSGDSGAGSYWVMFQYGRNTAKTIDESLAVEYRASDGNATGRQASYSNLLLTIPDALDNNDNITLILFINKDDGNLYLITKTDDGPHTFVAVDKNTGSALGGVDPIVQSDMFDDPIYDADHHNGAVYANHEGGPFRQLIEKWNI